MKIRSLIAQKFGIDADDRGWQDIHCPFHHDENKSAAVNFSFNRFTCLAGCNSRNLKQFLDDVKGARIKTDSDHFVNDMARAGKKTKQRVKSHTVTRQADELLNFLESRKLSMRTVSKLRGELVADVSDPLYGYLVFPFEGGRVGRKILDVTFFDRKKNKQVPAPRYRTYIGNTEVSNNLKGLLGAENIAKFHDLILNESVTDHVTLAHLGYENIVSSLGAGLSDYQAYLLRNRTVFTIYDRDYTGYKKAKAAQLRLKEWGTNNIILEIPSRFGTPLGKIDISSAYVDRGIAEFKEWLDGEISRYADSDRGYVDLLRGFDTLQYYPCGIDVIDEALEGGFTQGLYGIGGETSVGKSTVAIVLARAFVKQKKKVLYETYELPKRQVWARYAAGNSNHSWVEIERNPSVLEMDVLAELEEASNYLKVASDASLEQLKARIRHYEIAIFDYLQRMPRGDKDVNNAIRLNNEFLSEQSMQGKTIIAISSVPRSAYGKDDDQSIFKGSGDIDYSTQASIKLSRVGDGRIYVNVTKNTRGKRPRGFIQADWPHQLLHGAD